MNPINRNFTQFSILVMLLICARVTSAADIDKTLSSDQINLLVKERVDRGAVDSRALREALNDELIRLELLTQEAKSSGLDKQPLVKLHADIARQEVIARDYLQEWLKSHPVAEDAIKKEYNTWVSTMGNTEYLLRDILVKSDEEAKGVIARLKDNEKFESIASKLTLDPNSRVRGGLQDWTGVGFLDKSIAAAVLKLSKGRWTAEPVKAQNGWHVILLEDSKPFVAPPYEQIRPQIKQNLEQKSIKVYVDGLKGMKR